MDEAQQLVGNNTLDDVAWLCSLSEPQLDLLISLKKLAIQRAKVIGHQQLANKFDLKTLRCLAVVIMEYTKGKLSKTNGLSELNALMDSCNLLNCESGGTFSVEQLKSCLEIAEKKPPRCRQQED